MRGDLSVDGRYQDLSSAEARVTRAGTMSDECRLEEWALSIWPSWICAQLHGTRILRIAMSISSRGAKAGGSKGGAASRSPSQAQTKPPHSTTG